VKKVKTGRGVINVEGATQFNPTDEIILTKRSQSERKPKKEGCCK